MCWIELRPGDREAFIRQFARHLGIGDSALCVSQHTPILLFEEGSELCLSRSHSRVSLLPRPSRYPPKSPGGDCGHAFSVSYHWSCVGLLSTTIAYGDQAPTFPYVSMNVAKDGASDGSIA